MYYRKKGMSVVFGFVMFFGIIIQPALASNGFKTFNIKLSFGRGFSSDSDLDTYINALDVYAGEIADVWGLKESGDIQWKNFGSVVGGELIVKMSRRFGLGIRIDYMVKNKNDHVELGPSPFIEGDFDFRLKVIPLTLSANYFIPVSHKTEIFVKGGIGYYWSRIDFELLSTALGGSMLTTGDMRDEAWGFQGGAGIEYRVSNRIALFFEGIGRLVKFSDWKGNEKETAPHMTDEKSGSVWLVDELYSGWNTVNYYPSITFGKESIDPAMMKNERRFKVNFSGFTFQVGVRIEF